MVMRDAADRRFDEGAGLERTEIFRHAREIVATARAATIRGPSPSAMEADLVARILREIAPAKPQVPPLPSPPLPRAPNPFLSPPGPDDPPPPWAVQPSPSRSSTPAPLRRPGRARTTVLASLALFLTTGALVFLLVTHPAARAELVAQAAHALAYLWP